MARPPVLLPIRHRVDSGDAGKQCERMVRSLIAHGLLYFNQDCAVVLSEDELALEALSCAVFGGKHCMYRLGGQDEVESEPVALSYYASRGGGD